jgi:hypothetical protein
VEIFFEKKFIGGTKICLKNKVAFKKGKAIVFVVKIKRQSPHS